MSLRTFFIPVLLALAGCGGIPMISDPPAQTVAPAPAEPRAAAQWYAAQAQAADSPQRELLLLQSAEALLSAGDADGARQRLNTADVAPWGDTLMLRKQVVLSRVLLAQGQADAAAAALEPLDALGAVSNADRATALVVRARARARRADALGAIADRARAAPHLAGEAERANRDALLELLQNTPATRLAEARVKAGGGVIGSWLELGQALQAGPALRGTEITRWLERYPNHPARAALEAQLPPPTAAAPSRAMVGMAGAGGVDPGQAPQSIDGPVAVLLPLSSGLQTAAAALQDGLMSAWYASAEPRPPLQFVDTDAGGVAAAYDQAVAQGAQAVIGPLRKEEVAELAARGALPVPTLALNAPDHGGGAGGLWTLSLDPRDEVAAAQEHALAAGLRRAVFLYSRDAWGERVFTVMRDQWESLGGSVMGVQSYAPDTRDPSDAVAAALAVDAGAARKRSLEGLLGTPLAYQAGSRQDVDVVFLAATAAQARLIEPYLRYHGAATLPVYATAQVWEPGTDAGLNRDLDGIHFCDAPAALTPSEAAPGGALVRLHALGHDAWVALTALARLQGGAALAGRTGLLRDAGGGRIGRAPACARFDAGVPRPLAPTGPLARAP